VRDAALPEGSPGAGMPPPRQRAGGAAKLHSARSQPCFPTALRAAGGYAPLPLARTALSVPINCGAAVSSALRRLAGELLPAAWDWG